MRLASVSDLHVDHPENRALLPRLVARIHEGGADVVLVVGDVSHRDHHIARTLEAFRLGVGTVVFVPGNHELFEPGRRPDAWPRYRRTLRRLTEEAGAHYLPAGPLKLGGVAVCGTCGWYDHSFLAPRFRDQIDAAALREKAWGGMVWSDAKYVAFRDPEGRPQDDAQVARRMEADLEAQLKEAGSWSDVRAVVVATHHLAYEAAVHRTGTLPWEFFNAFMGSRRLGSIISAAPKVRTAVFGHTHRPSDQIVDGIRVVGTPLGYPRERREDDDIAHTRVHWMEF
ncbi:MAG: metallophosphoesterase [Myxococcota bacterium]